MLETKRNLNATNETKRNETKYYETQRNILKCETKRNETKYTKMRNETKICVKLFYFVPLMKFSS
jgi:hypothetical protein